MKKGLLTIGLILTGVVSYAQVVFNVQSPSSISGNYDLTYAAFGGDWGVGDLMDPLEAVEDTLMFVEDGTPGLNAQGNPISREGCNSLINDLTGKIAVVYRNTCEFGTKAFNAQVAGARAVIIVNREDALISIGGGTDGINDTIPVIFVSSVTGQHFINLMNAGETVTAFIGNKTGLFDNDLGIVKSKVLIPSPNTNHSLLSLSANENSSKLGGMVYNYGNNDQTDVMLKAEVLYGNSVVFTNTVLAAANLASFDSVLVNLPDFTLPNYPIGKYTLNYYLTFNNSDEYESDNMLSTDFYVSEDLFSYSQLDANGLPTSPQGYRSSTATTSNGACVHFQDPNASRVKLEGLYFSASTGTESVLLGQEITVDVMEWNDVFTDMNDPAYTALTEFALTNIATYTFTYDGEYQDSLMFVPFVDSSLTLIDNKRYIACVTTFDANTFFGYSDLNYEWVLDTLNQPVSPVISDDAINMNGFGDPAASIGLKLIPNNTTPLITSNGLTEICTGDEITLYSSISSGNQWNLNGTPINGATNSSLVVTAAGSYTVTVGANTSEAIVTTENTYPTVPTITSTGSTVCEGNMVTLTSDATSNNRWSNGELTQSITVDASGTYYVDVNNGTCVSSSTPEVVTINPLPFVNIQSLLTQICAGSTIDIVATGAVSYTWDDLSTNPTLSITPAISTTYTVVGIDGNGCIGSDDITINVVSEIVVTITPSSTQVCEGGTVTLTANGAAEYLWGGSETNSSITVTPTTANNTYTVGGVLGTCTDDASITITVNSLPSVSYSELQDTTCGNYETFNLTEGSPASGTYSGTGVIGNTFNPSQAVPGDNVITYTYEDGNGCESSATSTIYVDACASLTEENISNVTVYPNPATDVLTIKADNLNDFTTIELRDQLGRTIETWKINKEIMTLNVSKVATGNYTIILTGSTGVNVQKVIIK